MNAFWAIEICVAYIKALKGGAEYWQTMWHTPLVTINYVIVAGLKLDGAKGIMDGGEVSHWNKMLDNFPDKMKKGKN